MMKGQGRGRRTAMARVLNITQQTKEVASVRRMAATAAAAATWVTPPATAAAEKAAAQAPAAFMTRGAAQILVLRTVKGALINSLARVINSSRGVIRPIQSSLAVDSIMSLLPFMQEGPETP